MSSKELLDKCDNKYITNKKHNRKNSDIFKNIFASEIFLSYSLLITFKPIELHCIDKHLVNIYIKIPILSRYENNVIRTDQEAVKMIEDLHGPYCYITNFIKKKICDKIKNNNHHEIIILLRNGLLNVTCCIDSILTSIADKINNSNYFFKSFKRHLTNCNHDNLISMLGMLHNQKYVKNIFKNYIYKNRYDADRMYKIINMVYDLEDDFQDPEYYNIIKLILTNHKCVSILILDVDDEHYLIEDLKESFCSLLIYSSMEIILRINKSDSLSYYLEDFFCRFGFKYNNEDSDDESEVHNRDICREKIIKVIGDFLSENVNVFKMSSKIINTSMKYDSTYFFKKYYGYLRNDLKNIINIENFNKYPNILSFVAENKIICQDVLLSICLKSNSYDLLIYCDPNNPLTIREIENNKDKYFSFALSSNNNQLIKWLIENFLTPEYFTWEVIERLVQDCNFTMLDTMITCGLGLINLRQNNNKLFKDAFHCGNEKIFLYFMNKNWKFYELGITNDEIAKICLKKHKYDFLICLLNYKLILSYDVIKPFLCHMVAVNTRLIPVLYERKILSRDHLIQYQNYQHINELLEERICGICQHNVIDEYHICNNCHNKSHTQCINKWIYGEGKTTCIYCRHKIIN